MQETAELEEKLKNLLLAVLDGKVSPDTLSPDVPLVRKGLALDSVKLLEFVLAIEGEFQIELDEGRLTLEHFSSLRNLAAFVHEERKRQQR